MTVIHKLASSLGRNDETPNQELVDCLFNADTAIRNDSIKVLYEIGEAQPELISAYTTDFIKLLTGKNNRLIWGAMTALATIAHLNPDPIFNEIDLIFDVIKKGSVITVDNGISVLAKVGAAKQEYEKKSNRHYSGMVM
ncbi:MAG: hypothetical protein GXY86_11180 [Firmicutes bacterium]|nr:hypothetical protein [Bacillota bacterium]